MWSVPVFQRVEESQAQDGQEGEDRKAAAGQGLLGRQGDWIQVQAAAINEKFFVLYSVVDPNTLNMDPDPDFGPIWIRILVRIWIRGYVIFFKKKNIRIRIWIYKAPEYGFNTDPDPQH